MDGAVGETSCLTLVWAVLDLLITHQTNGIHFNALDRQRLTYRPRQRSRLAWEHCCSGPEAQAPCSVRGLALAVIPPAWTPGRGPRW